MIRVLMLDLGETLIHDEAVFPHVPDALAVLSQFEIAAGKPLELCLVSDFTMPTAPVTQAKINAIFREYLAILERVGLMRFFQPSKRRVTLSTHAGVRKPARAIFEKALQRLGSQAGLNECLFITENAEHLVACRAFGMKTLQFGATGGQGIDFSDWSEAPLLIARLIGPGNLSVLQAALAIRLKVVADLELVSMTDVVGDRVRLLANQLHPMTMAGSRHTIHVPVLVEVEITLDARGRIAALVVGEPEEEMLAEAEAFAATLQACQQVSQEPGPLPSGATHRIETDAQGRSRLKRGRYSLR